MNHYSYIHDIDYNIYHDKIHKKLIEIVIGIKIHIYNKI